MANEKNLKPFKKGYDIRRGSKPKGAKHISTHIRELLEDVEITYTYRGSNITGIPIDAIIKSAIIKAVNGDLKAAELLIKYGYGPPKQEAEQEKIVIVTRAHHKWTEGPKEKG